MLVRMGGHTSIGPLISEDQVAQDALQGLGDTASVVTYSQGLPAPVGELGQQLRPKTTVILGSVGILFNGTIAYLLLANAGKWKSPLKQIGYVYGVISALWGLSLIGVVAVRASELASEKEVAREAEKKFLEPYSRPSLDK